MACGVCRTVVGVTVTRSCTTQNYMKWLLSTFAVVTATPAASVNWCLHSVTAVVESAAAGLVTHMELCGRRRHQKLLIQILKGYVAFPTFRLVCPAMSHWQRSAT